MHSARTDSTYQPDSHAQPALDHNLDSKLHQDARTENKGRYITASCYFGVELGQKSAHAGQDIRQLESSFRHILDRLEKYNRKAGRQGRKYVYQSATNLTGEQAHKIIQAAHTSRRAETSLSQNGMGTVPVELEHRNRSKLPIEYRCKAEIVPKFRYPNNAQRNILRVATIREQFYHPAEAQLNQGKKQASLAESTDARVRPSSTRPKNRNIKAYSSTVCKSKQSKAEATQLRTSLQQFQGILLNKTIRKSAIAAAKAGTHHKSKSVTRVPHFHIDWHRRANSPAQSQKIKQNCASLQIRRHHDDIDAWRNQHDGKQNDLEQFNQLIQHYKSTDSHNHSQKPICGIIRRKKHNKSKKQHPKMKTSRN